jgi:hypothetical protein
VRAATETMSAEQDSRHAHRGRRSGRGERIAWVALAALVVGAIAVRIGLMLAYGPAFLGFGDSHEYVSAAANGVFSDPQKPAGYPIFLSVVHLLSDHLSFTVALQHVLGIATGLLLFDAVRHTGVPSWLGLLPAAVVFFAGNGLLLEHSLLGDGLFAFVQALAIYAAVRALGESRWRWAVLAGLAVGVSFWIKTVGLSSLVVIAVVLLLGAPGNLRERVKTAAAVAATALLVILAYPVVQAQVTGYSGYERQGAWNLYGRVATFVDCAKFKPPAGTRFLCPSEALSDRQSESYYQYARASPAVRRFGGPAHASRSANATLQRFSVAAIEHEPLAYAGAILRGLSFFITPRPGEGYTPESLREALLSARGAAGVDPAISRYFERSDRGYVGHPSALVSYDEHTQVQGPLLVLLLAMAVAGTLLLDARARSAAVLFTLSALASVALAVAGNSYDVRYGYPALGPLAAGAALGGWGIFTKVRMELERRRTRTRRRQPV